MPFLYTKLWNVGVGIMALVAAKCPQCGANIKVDSTKDAGICEYCGTAFIVEKAINNYKVSNNYIIHNANIQGGPNLENLLKLAERALHDDNNAEATKYFEQVLLIDPDNWKAVFYSRYCKFVESRIIDIENVANSINSSIDTVLNLIKGNVSLEEEQKQAVLEVAEKVGALMLKFEAASRNYFKQVEMTNSSILDFSKRMMAICAALTTSGNSISYIFKDTPSIAEISVVPLEQVEVIVKDWYSATPTSIVSADFKVQFLNMMKPLFDSVQNGIMKYEPDYNFPNLIASLKTDSISSQKNYQQTSNSSNSNNGCYIATCVYGSYDCPEVWTLRRFRDFTLDSTWYGRIFIKCYYAVSPTLVKWFGNQKWFKVFWKNQLDIMVEKLKKNGIKDTFYEDKY